MDVMRWVQGETGQHPAVRLDTGEPATDTLQGATVTLDIETLDGTSQLVENGAVIIVDADDMAVTYDRQQADVADPGRFRFRYKVTYSNLAVQMFPQQGFGLLVIEPSGGAA